VAYDPSAAEKKLGLYPWSVRKQTRGTAVLKGRSIIPMLRKWRTTKRIFFRGSCSLS
jgi:hypothetical protein